MAFLTILRRTLADLTRLKGNLAILLIGVGISVALTLALGWDVNGVSAEMQKVGLVSTFLFTSFIWTAGLFLAIIVSVKGVGQIAGESSDGTLTLLVSRPLSRWQILAGKFVALIIYGIFLDFIILLLSAFIIGLIKPVTDEALIALLSAVLRQVPYVLLVTLIFGSISIALSAITKRRIAIAAVVCTIVTVVFLLIPIVTEMINTDSDNGDSGNPYLNPVGHLGNIFIRLNEGGWTDPDFYDRISPFAIGDLSTADSQLPSLTLPITGYDGLPFSNAYYPMEYIPRLSPFISLGIWLLVIVLCLGGSFMVIERKQLT